MAIWEVELEDGSVYEIETEDKPNLMTAPGTTLARSGGEFIGSIANAVMHPIETVKALGGLAIGAGQKMIPGVQPQERYVDSLANVYRDRYGSPDLAKTTLLEDPVGALADLAMLASGGGAAAAKIGQVGRVGRLEALGNLAAKTGNAIDPIAGTVSLLGKGAEAAMAGRKIAPFASKVDADVVDAGRNLGVDLPASAISNSRAVPAIEALAGKGLFGGGVQDKIARAQERMSQIADAIVKKTGKSPDLVTAGMNVHKGAEAYRANFMRIKNQLYEDAILPRDGRIIEVNPSKSLEFIDSVLANKRDAAELLGSAQDIAYFKNLREGLDPKKTVKREIQDPYLGTIEKGEVINVPLNGKKVQAAIRELNEKINNISDPVATGNKATLKKLVASLSDDLDAAIIQQRPDLAKSIQTANAFYKQGIDKLNSVYGEKIFDLGKAGQYDKIVPALTSPTTSIEDIPKIYEIIGKDNIPQVQSAFLEEFFKASKNANGAFTPHGVTRQIEKYGDAKLKTILTPDQYKIVKDLGTVTRGMGKAEKIASGSQTAFLTRLAAEATLLFTNPVKALYFIGGDAMISKFLGSKTGQELLGKGWPLAPAGRATRASSERLAPRFATAGRAARIGEASKDA